MNVPSNIPPDVGGKAFGEAVSVDNTVNDPEEKTTDGATPAGFSGANVSRIS